MAARPDAGGVERVLGIDWSGARDAGSHIWIASARRAGATLQLEWVRSCTELTGAGPERGAALDGLCGWLATQGSVAVGLDFPFSLPAALLEGSWRQLIDGFSRRFPSPEAFREDCRLRAGGRELKRETDRLTKTPFSAYNLRLYRQTYWGITALLAPLVSSRRACVLPMQRPRPGRPWLLETCPASWLKREGLYWPYKGAGDARAAGRARVVDTLIGRRLIRAADGWLARLHENRGGDALDAVLAALAVHRSLDHPEFPRLDWRPSYAREAMVYV